MTLSPPTEVQLDALREVANVGCGHAASALSQLVGGRKVEIDVPRVAVTPVGEMPEMIGGAESQVVAASLGMTGDLTGHLLVVLPDSDAHLLCSLLLNAPSTGTLNEVERSALSEAANIVASACLTAMGDLTGLRLLPSVPTLTQELASSVVDEALERVDCGTGLVLVLEARFFTATAPSIAGQFLVLPDRRSLSTLLQRLGV